MATLMTYDQMWLGRVFRPHVFDLDEATVAAYGALFGPGPDAPPSGLIAVHARKSYLTEGEMPSGGVMAGLTLTYHRPFTTRAGLTFQAEVVDRYERNDRPWVHVRSVLSDPDGPVATVLTIGVWPR